MAWATCSDETLTFVARFVIVQASYLGSYSAGSTPDVGLGVEQFRRPTGWGSARRLT